jgi:hypothetical protein
MTKSYSNKNIQYIRDFHPSILLLIVFIYISFNLSSFIPHFCLFEKFLQIHCPLCGTTNSIKYLLNGEMIKSMELSLVGIPFIIYLILYQIFLLLKKHDFILHIERILTFFLFFNFIKQFLWQ